MGLSHLSLWTHALNGSFVQGVLPKEEEFPNDIAEIAANGMEMNQNFFSAFLAEMRSGSLLSEELMGSVGEGEKEEEIGKDLLKDYFTKSRMTDYLTALEKGELSEEEILNIFESEKFVKTLDKLLSSNNKLLDQFPNIAKTIEKQSQEDGPLLEEAVRLIMFDEMPTVALNEAATPIEDQKSVHLFKSNHETAIPYKDSKDERLRVALNEAATPKEDQKLALLFKSNHETAITSTDSKADDSHFFSRKEIVDIRSAVLEVEMANLNFATILEVEKKFKKTKLDYFRDVIKRIRTKLENKKDEHSAKVIQSLDKILADKSNIQGLIILMGLIVTCIAGKERLKGRDALKNCLGYIEKYLSFDLLFKQIFQERLRIAEEKKDKLSAQELIIKSYDPEILIHHERRLELARRIYGCFSWFLDNTILPRVMQLMVIPYQDLRNLEKYNVKILEKKKLAASF